MAKAEKSAAAATAAGEGALSKDAKEDLEILRRENRLMASAWFDLTGRLQSNTVLVTRRQEMPRSWVGRQRVAVGGPGGMKR